VPPLSRPPDRPPPTERDHHPRNFATRLLLETGDGIKKLRGHVYPYGSAQLVPTYHPAAALRSGAPVVAEMRADFVRAKRLLPGAVGR